MKLIVQLKLLPTPEQADALLRTLETTNAACNFMSQVAWDTKTFSKFDVQKLCYEPARVQFGLAAQVTIRALAKVGDAYKLDRTRMRSFRPHAAIAYDDRILSYAIPDSSVSIWTLGGRERIAFVCGPRQRELLASRQGETDLAFVRGAWYLFAVGDVEAPEPQDVDDMIGIDLGVTNIATDSDGTIHSARTVKNVRYRHRRLRHKLQKKGTLAAKRRLRRLAGQEARFAKDVNHFRERTLRPHQPALPGTLTPTEVLLCCLDERGGLDIAYIATLAGQSRDTVIEELGERVYRIPGTTHYALLYHLLLALGLRRGEGLGLSWDDLDWEAGTLQIRRQVQAISAKVVVSEYTKTDAGPRTLPIAPALLERLRAHWHNQQEERALMGPGWNERGLVFATDTGGRVSPSNLLRHYRMLLKCAGLAPLRLHDLRHTCATLLGERVGDRVIAAILGHTPGTVTARYAKVTLAQMREALEGLYEELTGGD